MDRPWGYLISDGTYNSLTKALLVAVPEGTHAELEIWHAVGRFIKATGTPRDQVCVNPVGKPLGEIPNPVGKPAGAGHWLSERG